MYPDDNGDMVYGGIDVSVAQYIADYTGKTLQTENMAFDYLLASPPEGRFRHRHRRDGSDRRAQGKPPISPTPTTPTIRL